MTNYFPNHQELQEKTYKRCYESHPDLIITNPKGHSFLITGGSCVNPFEGYDIYVGFDQMMDISKQHYPWHDGYEVVFPIRDGHAPEDVEEFKKLVDWLEVQLVNGNTIHLGCIGGHGRTGLVLSALYAQMSGKADAIQYVRKHYCKKAVESKEQIKFLKKHYKVKDAPSVRTYTSIPASSFGKEYRDNCNSHLLGKAK
jgi:hypothetical protein